MTDGAEVLGESCLAEIVGRPEGRRRKGCNAYLVGRTSWRLPTASGRSRGLGRVGGRLRAAARHRCLYSALA